MAAGQKINPPSKQASAMESCGGSAGGGSQLGLAFRVYLGMLVLIGFEPLGARPEDNARRLFSF